MKESVIGDGRSTIRKAIHADRSFLVSLSQLAFIAYSDSPRVAMNRMLTSSAVTLIAEHRRVRLGFALVDVSEAQRAVGPFAAPRVAYLSAIAVVPEGRGCGIGHDLLDAVENYAREQGAVAMALHTATNNTDALRLFKRAGYQPILPLQDFYADSQSAIRMLKSLSLA
jgi:ribosomal protein S18 acetylase RimI-like enzyme